MGDGPLLVPLFAVIHVVVDIHARHRDDGRRVQIVVDLRVLIGGVGSHVPLMVSTARTRCGVQCGSIPPGAAPREEV